MTHTRLAGDRITVGDAPAQFTKFLEAHKDRRARAIEAAGVKAE